LDATRPTKPGIEGSNPSWCSIFNLFSVIITERKTNWAV
jgi:hypothetical protein